MLEADKDIGINEDNVMIKDDINANHSDKFKSNVGGKNCSDESSKKRNNNLIFNDISKQMDALKTIIFNATESNQSKLQFIQEELSTNRYEIDCEYIASKLLEYAQMNEEAEMA